MDLYISTHCDGDKSDLNLAIAQVVATVPGCDADALTNELKRVVCDELYTREHEKYRSCDFVDTAWPPPPPLSQNVGATAAMYHWGDGQMNQIANQDAQVL